MSDFELVVEDIKGYLNLTILLVYEKIFDKYNVIKRKLRKVRKKTKVVAKLIFEEYLIKAMEKQKKTNNWLVKIRIWSGR